MKTLFFSLFSAAALALSAGEPDPAYARAALLSTEIESTDAHSLSFRFNNPLEKEVEVKLRSAEGILVFQKDFHNDEHFSGVFQMESLPSGNYQFEVFLDNILVERFAHAITANANEGDHHLVTTSLAVGNNADEMSLLINNPLNTQLSLHVRDSRGKLVHYESLSDDAKVRQLLNTDMLTPDTYRLEIWSNNVRVWHMTIVREARS